VTNDDLDLAIKRQKIYHIQFWIRSCRDQYLRALSLIDFHDCEEIRKDWFALHNLTEEKYPLDSMSKYYEILFKRYTNEISKSDLVTQKDLFDPFFKMQTWGSYFTNKLIPAFLEYDDDIRSILKLAGALIDDNRNMTSKQLVDTLRKFDMPVL
jgi:hypothetical protein